MIYMVSLINLLSQLKDRESILYPLHYFDCFPLKKPYMLINVQTIKDEYTYYTIPFYDLNNDLIIAIQGSGSKRFNISDLSKSLYRIKYPSNLPELLAQGRILQYGSLRKVTSYPDNRCIDNILKDLCKTKFSIFKFFAYNNGNVVDVLSTHNPSYISYIDSTSRRRYSIGILFGKIKCINEGSIYKKRIDTFFHIKPVSRVQIESIALNLQPSKLLRVKRVIIKGFIHDIGLCDGESWRELVTVYDYTYRDLFTVGEIVPKDKAKFIGSYVLSLLTYIKSNNQYLTTDINTQLKLQYDRLYNSICNTIGCINRYTIDDIVKESYFIYMNNKKIYLVNTGSIINNVIREITYRRICNRHEYNKLLESRVNKENSLFFKPSLGEGMFLKGTKKLLGNSKNNLYLLL